MSQIIEIYTTAGCPHCAAAREDLEWRRLEYAEYDVEQDEDARARMLQLTGGARTVPVIVGDGQSVKIGWMGHRCII